MLIESLTMLSGSSCSFVALSSSNQMLHKPRITQLADWQISGIPDINPTYYCILLAGHDSMKTVLPESFVIPLMPLSILGIFVGN